MEVGDENSGNASLKRQRAPLSDSEDNVFSPAEMIDGQKRRRLAAVGQENRSPKQSNSGRLAELEIKPDTPMVPSVRSRVQELTQRREAGAPLAQRCLSDPGTDSPSADKGFREHRLGAGEFSQRMEQFKVPVFQSLPAPSPGPHSTITCSNFVSDIQQKLQGATTPSAKQASRIRQEREQELSQLHFQPISENAWLKRSSSDPSLAQQVHGKSEMKDGSFTESPMSGAERTPINTTGERELLSSDGQQMEWKEQNTKVTKQLQEEGNYKALGENNEKLRPQEGTVLKLSFFEDQNVSSNGQRLLELTPTDKLTKEEINEVPEVTGSNGRELFSFEESEKMDNTSYNDEEIEPSTDEEFKLWRYPQYKACSEDESLRSEELQDELCAKEEVELESSVVEEPKAGSVADHCDPSQTQDCICSLGDISAEIAICSELQKDEKCRPEEDPVKKHFTLKTYQANKESNDDCNKRVVIGGTGIFTTQDQKDPDARTHKEDEHLQSKDTHTIEEHMDQESNSTGPTSKFKQVTSSPFADVAHQETQIVYLEFERNTDIAKAEAYGEPLDITGNDPSVGLTEVELSESGLIEETVQEVIDKRPCIINELSSETQKAEGGESLKKVTFILEPELINDSALSEASASVESMAEMGMSDAELSSHDDTNTTEMIDQMFEEVLEYAGRMEEENGNDDDDAEDTDSGIGACSGDKDKMDIQSKTEKSEDGETKQVYDDSKKLESNDDELLTFPPSGILSPLSKSVEAVVTPLRLAANQESNLPSLLLTSGETPTPTVESAPLYSVDAYRTQRQGKLPAAQSITSGVQRQAPQKSQPQCSVNIKERITTLNEEAVKLQTVINQTLQALSCCTDEEHGRGSLEEAEAEKLLLVSCEKRSALLAEVSRLREKRNSASGGKDTEHVSQQPCRGTVSITNIQLPLKVEFVCSSHSRAGRPNHYFFILIRYGPCNVIATPLATAADAQNGDTISFPTSVTLKDIRSSFEIDVEVYSLSHTTTGSNCSIDRTTTKSRVTPRKLLNTITRSSNLLASAALPGLSTRRSSNFCLVGSHKITLASLGHSKFPLDKMKLEGKIRRLLGDEFQEKVPFLSPLEGSIYLQLESHSHSNVQHQGFLTMFELISGYGVWHRRYFVLEGCSMFYWNHPNDRETKEAEGSISLSRSMSLCVRPVKRDLCARPFTFELVSNIPHQQQDGSQEAFPKCWFSADTKQERLDWTEKLNQALLDFHTWNRISTAGTESRQSNISSGNIRESIL